MDKNDSGDGDCDRDTASSPLSWHKAGREAHRPHKTEGSTPQETHKAHRRRHGEEKEGKHLDIQGQKCNFADTTPRQATMHHTPRPHAQPDTQEATA